MFKLTVLMPVHNGASYLVEAIDSILIQSFVDFELLILDDGSTDDTASIVESYSDHRIRYHRNAQNCGIVQTLNTGIDLSSGEYIARMDADDISLPDRFLRQVSYLDLNPQVAVCAGLYEYIGDLRGRAFWPINYRHTFTLLSRFCCIGHPTVMIRRRFLMKHSLRYDPDYQWAEDYELWVRLAVLGRIDVLPQTVLYYRSHINNLSHKKAQEQLMLSSKVRCKWFETVLSRKLKPAEEFYILSKANDLSSQKLGLELVKEIMQLETSLPLDKEIFGEMMIREWLAKVSYFSTWLIVYKYFFDKNVRLWSRYTVFEISIVILNSLKNRVILIGKR